MELFILPSLDVVKAEMGFEPWEEVDGYSLLYKQGQEGYQIEVEDGETFEIPEDSEGQILDDDTIYFWKTEPIDDEFADEFYDEFADQFPIEDNLYPGRYRLEGNDIIKLTEPELY